MIPLTVRSNYSLMWGTAPAKRVCRAARRLGYTHLALTDTDNLCSLWPFLNTCRREGLTPIVGAEVTDPQRKQRILARTPMGRLGEPDDIGWAAVYLCSEQARFVTGQQLVVDGGASIGF